MLEANLTSIARFYLPDADLVRVSISDLSGSGLAGLAWCSASGYRVIEIDGGHVLIGRVFFHELGHHVLGHVVSKLSGSELERYRLLDIGQMNFAETEKAALQGFIDGREAEADAWAETALAQFEARFGPFAKAIGG